MYPEVPHTHDFQIWLPYEADVLTEAAVRQAEETGTMLFISPWDPRGPGLSFTEVHVRAPGLEWSEEDVKAAVARFVAQLPPQITP